MKTTTFRLLATIITLAAVTATNTTNAQRRSTSDNNSDKRVENTRTANKSNVEKKSAYRNDAKPSQTSSRSAKSYSDVKRNTPTAAKEIKKEVSRTADYVREKQSNSSNRPVYTSKSGISKKGNSSTKVQVATSTEMPRRSTGYSAETNRSGNRENYNSNRVEVRGNSERYNLNTNDDRYKPNREYKGRDKYWSSDYGNGTKNSNHSHEKYGYNNHNYWDRNWESYRWNHNSWINYYGYYSPYSFKYHKYYYHHNYYGHVIRKFVYRPQIYIHNHVKYYCYDGNFFRYRSRVGYVLVDIPFGMAFEYIPGDYDRVYVNGYLYFRVGNLFFESTNYGFQLVHYPERYYAYSDGYCNEGFRFNDMIY